MEHRNIDEAVRRTNDWIRRMRDALSDCDPAARLCDSGHGFVAVGSVGRREAVVGSDVDLILVIPRDAPKLDPDVIAGAHARARDSVSDALGVKVSKGTDLTRPTSSDDLACADRIGGENDSRDLLTRRVLLLTESVPIVNDVAWTQVRSALFAEYFSRSRSKGRHMLSLTNDIVRYYRTLMIDYKAKVDAEGKPWAPRNVKLRHSRKYWFFATALALVAADRSERDPAAAERTAGDLLGRSPTDRLAAAASQLGVQDLVEDVIDAYDKFLGLYGDPGRRVVLESLEHERRDESPVFREFRSSGESLHEAMIRLVDEMDAEARRDLISHFML